ncbi:hypothetical protein [Gordonia soli]|uniref:Uncharacterized protein n=1 Tax=Gordonia soli NBRC 108243 TaxID=1223545 RepID=M0QGM6_9ACTN|nr:hypothetical protein [Gordonia soli]GAC67599.1 hypothetical protein GS4_08_01840 [Gordonia soli NBRC 108243]
MGQLSFFSAETDEPVFDDLAGLLAAHGQSVRSAAGTRVSVVVTESWRAEALVAEMRATGLDAETAISDEGNPIARTVPDHRLDAMHSRWTTGAVKAMPAGWVPSPRALRIWVIAAGRPDAERYLLGLDPHDPESHAPLATALMRAGIAPTLVGTRGHSPALRVAGRRRLTRLVENVGSPPELSGASAQWPSVGDF